MIDWESIPDLGLYMDQTVSFVQQQMSEWTQTETVDALTPSMVNNYAKKELIPRPDHRKYYREHIALLLVIAFLKNTLSMDEIGRIFRSFGNDASVIYACFTQAQKECGAVPVIVSEEEILRFAYRVNRMQLQLRGAVSGLPGAAEEKEEPEKPKQGKKGKKKADQK